MGRLLIATANPAYAEALRAPLARLGTVVHVGDGAAAAAALGECDLALLDVALPGVDGIELCRRVRSRGGHLPIVFVASRDTDLEHMLGSGDPGADDYIMLPLTEAEIFARVNSVLRAKQLEAQMRRHSSELEIKVVEHSHRMEALARELRVERDALRETFNVIEEGLLLVDAAGNVLIENPAGAALRATSTKGPPSGGGGLSEFELGVRALADAAVKLGERCERHLVHRSRHLQLRGYPAAGQRALIHVRDITEERDREVRRLQAEKLASIGLLAAGVAHEINNPASFVLANLDALNGLMQLLDERLEARPDLARALGLEPVVFEAMSILQESKEGMARIYRIVRDLHSFSRVDDDDSAITSVNGAIESSLSLMRNELRYRATVERDLSAQLMVRGGAARLGQVFLNLILNAAHAMSEGGPKRNRLWVRSRDERGEVVVEIEDNGPGVPPDVLPHIFESFFTTKPRGVGTGLGLPISRDIVRSLGGEIEARSKPGQGALFRVRLPAVPEQTPLVEAGSEPVRVMRRRRVLAVDDEALLLKAYRRMLVDHHDVETKRGALEALECLEVDQSFDVVLCDLQMPDMSGADMFARVKTRWPQLAERFIFITGGAFSPELKRFLDDQVPAYIQKPFHVKELLELVERRAMATGST